jgi:hypothetical protein
MTSPTAAPESDLTGSELAAAGQNGHLTRQADGEAALAAQLSELDAALPAIIEGGAMGVLLDLGARAGAQAIYEESQEHEKAANICMRAKLKCEAALGVIDMEASKFLESASSLVVGGSEIGHSVRRRWRTFGVLLDRGLLDSMLDELELEGELTTVGLRHRFFGCGAGYVPASALPLGSDQPRGARAALLRKAGLSPKAYQGLVTLRWTNAKAIAQAAGIDPLTLPLAPARTTRRGKRRLWLRRALKPTGGRWDEAASRLQLFLDEFQRVATPTVGTRYDAAFDHLYAVRDLIARELAKERAA